MITVLITVRTSSTRLPSKCFLPFGTSFVLKHVIERAIHFKLYPIVSTTVEALDDPIYDFCCNMNIPCYRGSSLNKLKRWYDTCLHFAVSRFHTIDADDPFFCPLEVNRSFSLLESGYDYILPTPTPSSSSGGATVGMSINVEYLKDVIDSFGSDSIDTEMAWSFFKTIPAKSIVLSDPLLDIITCRLTLDYYEDYILLHSIVSILGHYASRSQIFKLFDDNPSLSLINSFRSSEWRLNQLSKSHSVK